MEQYYNTSKAIADVIAQIRCADPGILCHDRPRRNAGERARIGKPHELLTCLQG